VTVRRRQTLTRLVALAVLFAAGIFAGAYVLLKERLPPPFRSTYEINAELAAANGVVPGLGQPVNVAGVQVGSITGTRLVNGLAELELQIDHGQLPHIYANADVTLAPVTPLGDVEVDVSPGGPPAAALAPGSTIGVAETTSPVALEDLLSNLDGDTRTWLSSLIASLGQGVGGQGPAIRSALATLGPTAAQLRSVTDALATRREDLAELVHDLAVVTRSASQDGQLSQLDVAGDQTMRALASEAAPLGQAITSLPGSLDSLDSTLGNLRTFAGQLTPTVESLLPAVGRLPQTLAALRPFARAASADLGRQIGPFVTRAAPLVGTLAPAARRLTSATPFLTSVLQTTSYFLNELAYNPQTDNQGYLYWMDWFFHNWNSVFSSGDANGISPRADVVLNCNILAGIGQLGTVLETALGVANLC
jgi:phospholipid/cholesterol/gamma-HCH transport system substrate-binding protein